MLYPAASHHHIVDKESWDSLADSFEADVLEIPDEDLHGILVEEIAKLSAGGHGEAADLGCGAGSLLPALEGAFSRIHAVDFAPGLLEQARLRAGSPRICFRKHDLSSGRPLPFTVDVTFCVNVLIHPRHEVREKMIRSVFRTTRKRGRCLVVVPSMEAVLHTYQTLIRIESRAGRARARALRAASRLFGKEVLDPVDGIVDIGTVPTKCYTREEITNFLVDAGFEIERVRRVEFPWSEEIDHAPSWLGAPYPWDWLVVARRAR